MKTMKRLLLLCFGIFAFSTYAQNLEIYVSDAGNFNSPPWQILKFDENGENPEVFIDENLVWPQDIVFLEDQDVVLISNLANPGYISKHDKNTGVYIGNFAENISGPTRMKIGDDDLLYVLQWSNTDNKVLRYGLDGTFVDEYTSAGVSQSIGLDWDSDGNLYVSSYGGKFVEKFDTDGNDLGAFIDSNLSGPTNIWFEENGDLMVVDYNGGAVKRFNSEGEYLGIFIPGLNNPEGIAFYPNGNILIGNGGTHAVKLFDSYGTFIEDFIPAGSGNLINPNAVVIRDITPVSVNEIEPEVPFITPSIGTTFSIYPAFIPEIESIRIFNSSGKLIVDKRESITGIVWQANGNRQGVYMIIARASNGMVLTKKVIVR
ncbi:MAG: T9SS type A sorting domain-containing protein [Bacteroidales bacterium]